MNYIEALKWCFKNRGNRLISECGCQMSFSNGNYYLSNTLSIYEHKNSVWYIEKTETEIYFKNIKDGECFYSKKDSTNKFIKIPKSLGFNAVEVSDETLYGDDGSWSGFYCWTFTPNELVVKEKE